MEDELAVLRKEKEKLLEENIQLQRKIEELETQIRFLKEQYYG